MPRGDIPLLEVKITGEDGEVTLALYKDYGDLTVREHDRVGGHSRVRLTKVQARAVSDHLDSIGGDEDDEP